MKKEKAAVEGTEIVPGIDPAIAIGRRTGIGIEIRIGTETGIGTGIVIGEGDPVLDHVTVMDIADATSIALDHVTADVHAQEIRGKEILEYFLFCIYLGSFTCLCSGT